VAPSEFVMSKTAPALHLMGVGDAAAGKIGLHLAALGQTDARIAWRYASDAVTKEGAAGVKKAALAEVVNLPGLDAPADGKGQVRITVTGAGGATLLDWQSQRAFGGIPTEVIADRGDVLNLGIAFNPVRDYARVFGDFINYDARGEIHEGARQRLAPGERRLMRGDVEVPLPSGTSCHRKSRPERRIRPYVDQV